MFNKSYQDRATRQGRAECAAVRKAGGGHQVAADAALRLSRAGIFEPWRPYVLTALAMEPAARNRVAGPALKKRGRRRKRDVLIGYQMDLFPLAELLPEAYETIEVR